MPALAGLFYAFLCGYPLLSCYCLRPALACIAQVESRLCKPQLYRHILEHVSTGNACAHLSSSTQATSRMQRAYSAGTARECKTNSKGNRGRQPKRNKTAIGLKKDCKSNNKTTVRHRRRTEEGRKRRVQRRKGHKPLIRARSAHTLGPPRESSTGTACVAPAAGNTNQPESVTQQQLLGPPVGISATRHRPDSKTARSNKGQSRRAARQKQHNRPEALALKRESYQRQSSDEQEAHIRAARNPTTRAGVSTTSPIP